MRLRSFCTTPWKVCWKEERNWTTSWQSRSTWETNPKPSTRPPGNRIRAVKLCDAATQSSRTTPLSAFSVFPATPIMHRPTALNTDGADAVRSTTRHQRGGPSGCDLPGFRPPGGWRSSGVWSGGRNTNSNNFQPVSGYICVVYGCQLKICSCDYVYCCVVETFSEPFYVIQIERRSLNTFISEISNQY